MREDKREKAEKRYGEEKKDGKEKKAGSAAARAFIFLLFTVSFAVGIVCFGLCLYMADNFFYTRDRVYVAERVLRDRGEEKARNVRDYINRGDLAGAKAYCDDRNFDVEIWPGSQWNGEDGFIWSSFDGEQGKTYQEGCARITEMLAFYNQNLPTIGEHTLSAEESYLFYVYIDLGFPLEDDLKQTGESTLMLYRARYWLIGAAALCLLVCAVCFVSLLRGAGHGNGGEGIVRGMLARLPFDLLTLAFAGGAAACCWFIYKSMEYRYVSLAFLPLLTAGGTLLAVLSAIYFMELAVRLRQGGVLSRTLVSAVLRGIRRGAVWVAEAVPAAVTVVFIFLAVCVLEFIVGKYMLEYVGYTNRPAMAMQQTALLWGAEKIALFVAVLYVAYICKKLLKASSALAAGQGDFRVDTFGMPGGFKKHGENLNSIGQGISRAVAEQMKSEHLKTELITNVSHDLKTPLTSIINYAELICGERTENGRIKEYAEVLFRQSRRLKKLLEDLIEASKATTGSLEVNLEPCEVGVLLTQAVGEYQHKLEEKELELIVRQPEEPVEIMADGRHLWRVFDNLLNNICKYSQEHSRVFLSIEVREHRAFIIFRNMSKYMLDVPPQELAERFVRGDKSRHMEGSGLGLSIAGSLMELQGGRMEIVTDGDLFKVILSFAILV